MSTMPTTPHYPTVAPFPIADVETVLGLVDSLDVEDATPEELNAVGRLRLVLVAAEQAQARARSAHPSFDELDIAQEDAGNLVALGVASHAGGHATEVEAADRLRLVAGGRRCTVLAAIVDAGPSGLTDYEVDAILGWEHGAAGKRRVELVTLGLVAKRLDDAGASLKRTIPGRGPACTWAATERAVPALRELGYVDRPGLGMLAPNVTPIR